ncbi:MAG: FkbM family methyltransferase [Bernardetiaceae bacterium]|nr:FkbM family methyltransferase [Bernardetiaceae bacterium]
MQTLAPIALFVYKRPWHTQQTLEALAANELADQSILYIFADGPQTDATEEQKEKIRQVRELIRSRKWCKEVHIVERQRNWGLADNIIDGVTQIVNRYERIIVLEDDLVTSPGFLRYMNEALELYANEPRVMHISGYMFPVELPSKPTTIFLPFSWPWGWATWKRAWNYFRYDPHELFFTIHSQQRLYEFNFKDSYPFSSQLEANVIYSLKTWAIRWYASIFLQNGMALYPTSSLIRNIGHDSSGEHCNTTNIYDSPTIDRISITKQKIKTSQTSMAAVRKYFIKQVAMPIQTRTGFIITKWFPERWKHFYRYYWYAYYRERIRLQNSLKKIKNMPRFTHGQIIINGIKIHFTDRDSFLLMYREIVEEKKYFLQSQEINVSGFIIDIGANIGLSVWAFRNQYPQATIHAFEPNSVAFQCLTANAAQFSAADKIFLHRAAVSGATGKRLLSTIPDMYSYLMSDPYSHHLLTEEVSVVSIRTLLSENFIDVLKIDAPGAELDILTDCESHLSKVRSIFVNCYTFKEREQVLADVISILERNGFRVYIDTPTTPSGTHPLIQIDAHYGITQIIYIRGVRE